MIEGSERGLFLALYSVEINKDKADQTYESSEQFVPRQCFTIQIKAYKQECNRNNCTLDDEPCIYLPPGFVCIEPSTLKPDDCNSKSKWSPVQLAEFFYNISMRSKNIVEDK